MLPFLVIAVLSAVAQLFLPWWSIAVVTFGVCFWRSRTGWRAFGNGFSGIAVVWFVYALLIHVQTDGILTGRMADLLFKTKMPVLLLLVTPLMGGLVGGFAGLAGRQVRAVFAAKP
ncbi:hypothetical protein [Larkinella rosea]|uniref:Uncharacterized protein n=1 Tax=Larkinella rosea TaxID=2025312 RepID=A0A3P1BD20_9BACT|nr:hypothetical protein [Larkinella rosea]RRA99000.1 hypothetical protein EHT25_28890 [Larkinella rosea]